VAKLIQNPEELFYQRTILIVTSPLTILRNNGGKMTDSQFDYFNSYKPFDNLKGHVLA